MRELNMYSNMNVINELMTYFVTETTEEDKINFYENWQSFIDDEENELDDVAVLGDFY